MNKTFEEAARENALHYYNRMVFWQHLTIAFTAATAGLGAMLVVMLVEYQALTETCAS